MRSQELEFLVRRRVEAVRSGRQVEDDYIELKSDWPQPPEKAARQLAGSANRCAGELIVLVVGVDESTGAVTTPARVEPGEWVAQLAKRFDQSTVPRLVRHTTVFLDASEAVTALAFDTSEVPYLVNTNDGRREIPIRAGATTRSAHRHEVVDLLVGRTPLPGALVLDAQMQAYFNETKSEVGASDVAAQRFTQMQLSFSVYLTHTAPSAPATLMGHELSARLNGPGLAAAIELYADRPSASAAHDAVRPGVHVLPRSAGDVLVTGSGRLSVSGSAVWPSADEREVLLRLQEATVEVTMGIAGSSGPLRFSMTLARESEGSPEERTDDGGVYHYLGSWLLVPPSSGAESVKG